MDTMFGPKKGSKVATKGQKQIETENKQSFKLYCIIGLLPQLFWLAGWVHLPYWAIASVIGSLVYMNHIASKGYDLANNGDYIKDIIITTTGCAFLSLLSNLFWLLWLWLPAYWLYKIWMTIFVPWIFQPAPEDIEDQELIDKKNKKKKRKMDRIMARGGYR